MLSSDFSLKASDGRSIFVRRWLPSGAPKAILLIAHGMAEHSARYERFASVMTEGGWAVYAPDHRGHGQTATQGKLGWLAEKDGFDRLREDLHELSQAAAAEKPGLPVFLYGHSMGSILAEYYLLAYGSELAGCALTGIAVPPSPPLLALCRCIAFLGKVFKGDTKPSKLLHKLNFDANNKDFAPNRTSSDWLSRDASEVDKYVADPLCGFVCSFGLYRDMAIALGKLYGRPSSFAGLPSGLPILIMAGAEDPVGGAKGFVPILADRYKAAGLKSVETRLYPGARHELLNETNRDEVMSDMKAWFESSLASIRD
jgi:Lysophospholipase